MKVLAGVMAALVLAAPAAAHDHAGEGGYSPMTGGPRLGLSAADVLSVAEPPGLRPLTKLEMAVRMNDLTASERRVWRRLGTGDAGGRAVVHRSGRFVRTRRAPPHSQQLDTGYTAAEPTMGIDGDGTLFYVGITFNQAGVPSSFPIRSRDGGRTWEEMDVLAPGVAQDTLTLDPFMYVDRDTGRVFNVDLVMPCTPVSYSDDKGDTWTTGSVCNHTDHQNLFTGPPPAGGPDPTGYPNVVYYCSIDGGALGAAGTFTGCSRSMDGGTSFERTATPPFVDDPQLEGGNLGIPGHCGGATGHGAVGPDGTVYLPRGYCGQPYLAISRDMGDTWERVQVAGNGFSVGRQLEEHEANVAVDREGNVYYTWVALDRLPYLAVSRDGGRTFGEPIMIAPPGVNEAWDVFVEAGDPGRLALIYLGTTNSPGPPFCARTTTTDCVNADGSQSRPASHWADTTWNGYMATTVTALRPRPTFFTTTVNDPQDELVRGECGPLRCQQEYDFLGVVIGPDGTPWASFVDGCPPDPDESCLSLGRGIVGHMTGGPPLTGPLPPPSPQPGAPTAPARNLDPRESKPRKRRCRTRTRGARRAGRTRRGAGRARRGAGTQRRCGKRERRRQ